jgi:phosphoglucomutase
VIDPSADYLALLRQVFDLDAIRALLARPDMSVAFDGMHGVAGPYAKKILSEIFKVKDLIRCDVLPDFGGGHPDPNLTYADILVKKMGL